MRQWTRKAPLVAQWPWKSLLTAACTFLFTRCVPVFPTIKLRQNNLYSKQDKHETRKLITVIAGCEEWNEWSLQSKLRPGEGAVCSLACPPCALEPGGILNDTRGFGDADRLQLAGWPLPARAASHPTQFREVLLWHGPRRRPSPFAAEARNVHRVLIAPLASSPLQRKKKNQNRTAEHTENSRNWNWI